MKSHRSTSKGHVHKAPRASAPRSKSTPVIKSKVADSFGKPGGKASAREQLDHVLAEAKRLVKYGLQCVAEPFVISAIINAVGSTVVHFAFGVPFDPKIMASFQMVGTLVGAAYPTAKAKVLEVIENVAPKHPSKA